MISILTKENTLKITEPLKERNGDLKINLKKLFKETVSMPVKTKMESLKLLEFILFLLLFHSSACSATICVAAVIDVALLVNVVPTKKEDVADANVSEKLNMKKKN